MVASIIQHRSQSLESGSVIPEGTGHENDAYSRLLGLEAPGDENETEELSKSRALELIAERKRRKRLERSRGLGL